MNPRILAENTDRITVEWSPTWTETYTRQQIAIAAAAQREFGFHFNVRPNETWEEFVSRLKARIALP